MRILLMLFCLNICALAAPTAPRLWGDLQPGRYAVGLRTERFEVSSGRMLELFSWYPARQESGARALTFAHYLMLAPELMSQEGRNAQSLRQSLSVAISSEPEGVAAEMLDQILASSMLAVQDARPVSGKFPLVLWSARHATTAAQAILSEYLASQGYVVAFVRLAGPPMPLPYEAKEPETKRATLEQHVRDLQAAVQRLSHQPHIAPSRIAVVTWSYAGESALRLQQREERVKLVISLSSNPLTNWVYQSSEELATLDASRLNATYVLLTERVATNGTIRTPPAILKSLPAGGCFVVFPELAHGNFNALEGQIPAVMGIAKVQRWSKSGPAAQLGYEAMARLTQAFLNEQLRRQARPSVDAWLRVQKLPDNFVTMECYGTRSPRTR